MGVESDNIEILKRAYQDWHASKGGAVDSLAALLHNDVRLTSLADGADGVAFTSKRTGKDDFLAYIGGLTKDWEMVFYRVDEYIAQGDRVVALGSTSWTNKQTRKTVTTPKVDVWRMRDGKAVEYSEFYDTAKLIAATQP